MFLAGGRPASKPGRAAVVTIIARVHNKMDWLAAQSEALERIFTALIVANPDGFLNPR